MSANILWRPTLASRGTIGTSTPSQFIEAMRNAFGDGSKWRLGTEDVKILKGMAAAFNGDGCPFDELIEHILKVGSIDVWAEY